MERSASSRVEMVNVAIRRALLSVLLFLVGVLGSTAALPQGDGHLPVIGQVWFVDPLTVRPWEDKFRDGLRELGYVDGKNLRIIPKYASGDASRLRPLIEELIALPVDVLVISPRAIDVALDATSSVPIVCYSLDTAISEGRIKNLARPGGNITGMHAQDAELAGKRLEIARELVADLKRVGVLFDPTHPASIAESKAFQALAPSAAVSVQAVGVSDTKDFEGAIKTLERSRAQVVFVADTPLLYMHRDAVLKLSAGRFPVIAHSKDWARSGALFTYAPDFYEMIKRTSAQVDKILKGAKAGDIPVEQAVAFELAINQKTAKAFGITMPETVLLRATEIIR